MPTRNFDDDAVNRFMLNAIESTDMRAIWAVIDSGYKPTQDHVDKARQVMESADGPKRRIAVANYERMLELSNNHAGTNARVTLTARGAAQPLKASQ